MNDVLMSDVDRRWGGRARCLVHFALVAAIAGAGLGWTGGRATAVEVSWSFDDSTLTPRFNNHTTSMVFLNGAATSDAVSFGPASSFGLPAMPGGDATVMQFPAFSNAQGLALYDLGPANGVVNTAAPADPPVYSPAIYINQYTMAWDILVPNVNANWFSCYQTTANNTSTSTNADGDFFIRPSDGGIGISGTYDGAVTSGEWHRIVAVVDATAQDPVTLAPRSPTLTKYIDGVLVGTNTLISGADGRWAMYTDTNENPPPTADAFILTDNSGDTNEGYISAFYYTDRVVDPADIAAWGGPKAFGLPGPGDVNFDGTVNIFDINAVSSNWNAAGPAGDANHDGIVNIFDINLISANWTPAGATAVPEPATVGLLLVGAALVGIGRKRFGAK